MDTVLLTALAKDPARRYLSAENFAQDVRAHLEGRPIRARSPGYAYRLSKFVGRNRWKVAAGVAGFLLAAVAILWAVDRIANAPPSFAGRLGQYRFGETPRLAAFDELRWAKDEPQVVFEGQWYEWVSVEGVELNLLLALARQRGKDAWRPYFCAEMLRHLAEQVPNAAPDRVDVELRPVGSTRIRRVTDVPLSEVKWLALQEKPGTMVPSMRADPRGRDLPRIAAFTGFRWKGETAEVRVGDRWYQLTSLCGIPFAKFCAKASEALPRNWRQRTVEDLPLVLLEMGLPLEGRVEAGLVDLQSGECIEHRSLPMTLENRRKLMKFVRESER